MFLIVLLYPQKTLQTIYFKKKLYLQLFSDSAVFMANNGGAGLIYWKKICDLESMQPLLIIQQPRPGKVLAIFPSLGLGNVF